MDICLGRHDIIWRITEKGVEWFKSVVSLNEFICLTLPSDLGSIQL